MRHSDPEHLGWRALHLAVRWVVVVFGVLLLVAIFAFWAGKAYGYDGCVSYPPKPPYEPTGIKGCTIFGEGTASHWAGPGVARNDCLFPWLDCTPIRIISLDTGRSIVVRPAMYCDCYTGTPDERIVDLDPAALIALGLETPESLREHRTRGKYPVVVEPASGEHGSSLALPNTSTQ